MKLWSTLTLVNKNTTQKHTFKQIQTQRDKLMNKLNCRRRRTGLPKSLKRFIKVSKSSLIRYTKSVKRLDFKLSFTMNRRTFSPSKYSKTSTIPLLTENRSKTNITPWFLPTQLQSRQRPISCIFKIRLFACRQTGGTLSVL